MVIINRICVLGGRKFTFAEQFVCIKRNQYAYYVFISCYKKLIFREYRKQNIRSFTLFPYFAFTKTMSEFTEGDFPDFWDHFKDAILAFYNATSDKY